MIGTVIVFGRHEMMAETAKEIIGETNITTRKIGKIESITTIIIITIETEVTEIDPENVTISIVKGKESERSLRTER
jgi:hypothetical protein